MISFCIKLSDAQAQAVLRSEGFSAGHGVRKSMALQQAEEKILDIIQERWNEQAARRSQEVSE